MVSLPAIDTQSMRIDKLVKVSAPQSDRGRRGRHRQPESQKPKKAVTSRCQRKNHHPQSRVEEPPESVAYRSRRWPSTVPSNLSRDTPGVGNTGQDASATNRARWHEMRPGHISAGRSAARAEVFGRSQTQFTPRPPPRHAQSDPGAALSNAAASEDGGGSGASGGGSSSSVAAATLNDELGVVVEADMSLARLRGADPMRKKRGEWTAAGQEDEAAKIRARMRADAQKVQQQKDKLKKQQDEKEAELESYREAFRIIDSDSSGTLEALEVRRLLRTFGKQIDEEHFWEKFIGLDADRNASLDMQEFCDAMERLTEKNKSEMRHEAMQHKFQFALHGLNGTSALVKEVRLAQASRTSGGHRLSEGTLMMSELIDQFAELHDVRDQSQHLRQRLHRMGMWEPPPDPRMRTMMGRRLLQAQQDKEANDSKAAQSGRDAWRAVDKFAGVFSKTPVS